MIQILRLKAALVALVVGVLPLLSFWGEATAQMAPHMLMPAPHSVWVPPMRVDPVMMHPPVLHRPTVVEQHQTPNLQLLQIQPTIELDVPQLPLDFRKNELQWNQLDVTPTIDLLKRDDSVARLTESVRDKIELPRHDQLRLTSEIDLKSAKLKVENPVFDPPAPQPLKTYFNEDFCTSNSDCAFDEVCLDGGCVECPGCRGK